MRRDPRPPHSWRPTHQAVALMWLEVNNLQTRVARGDASERSWLHEFLSFEDEEARYRSRWARSRGRPADGRIRLYSAISESFPTGLLPLVARGARDAGIEVGLIDKRLKPCAPVEADLSYLSATNAVQGEMQLAAVEACVSKGRGIVWVPTGGGKTWICIAITQRLPCRWLFVVNSIDLMEQMARRYEEITGARAGRVGEGTWDEDPRFTACTFQTLWAAVRSDDRDKRRRAERMLATAQGIICDECHVAPSESYLRLSMKTPNAYYRFGVSGTPLARGDKRSLYAIAAYGPVIYRARATELIEAGVLARPRIRLVPVRQNAPAENYYRDPNLKWSESDDTLYAGGSAYARAYQDLVVESSARNAAVVACARRAAKPALLFVQHIAHGKALQKALSKVGTPTEFVWGSASVEQRQAAIRRLERGDVEVLVTSVIFQTGVDIPSLASCVVATGGKSIIATLQRIGRGMRTDGGKKSEFEVWDVTDEGNRWLERHSKARARAYLSESYETVTTPVAALALAQERIKGA